METKIIDYGMNGEGVAKINGKVVLIPNTLIDELVDFAIVEDNGNLAYGKVNKIIIPSENRINPPCPYFYECGGCGLQHMSYSEQLRFKTLLVKKTLRKILKRDFSTNPTIPCKYQYSYRNKVSFSTDGQNIGYYQYNSKHILNIDFCPLANEDINKIYNICCTYIRENHLLRVLKHIVIRNIDSQYIIGIVLREACDISTLFDKLKCEYNQIGLYLIINNRRDSVVLSGKVTHIAGIKEMTIINDNIEYNIDILGFHQTNIDIQNKLYSHVLKHINNSDIVLNGFSGAGLLSAMLTKKAKKVIGIEIDPSSHRSAQDLKKKNHITNLTNINGDFHKEFKRLKTNIDTIILDPSKKGCGEKTMNEINGIKNIIYISCNPIALAKDLRAILPNYDIVEITPFDMFPNTTNVETLVVLKKKN